MRATLGRRRIGARNACALLAALLVLNQWVLAFLPAHAQTPLPTVRYGYDPLGRLIFVIDGQGNARIFSYDAVGNLLSITAQTGVGAVAILTVTPAAGPVGTEVVLTGVGFGATPGENTVSFNGTPASVLSAAPNRLVVTVPPGATTGPIVVTTPAGTAGSSSPFRVEAVVITGFQPTSGPEGTAVIISGLGFSDIPEENVVAFNGTPAVVSQATATALVADVPPGATTGPITVTVPTGTGTSASAFTVIPPTPPTITGFEPASGVTGTTVTIAGTGFSVVANRNTVAFNGATGGVLSASETQLVASVPCDATTGPITVTTPIGSATSTEPFTVTGGFCD